MRRFGRATRALATFATAALALSTFTACAPATFNVRASRAYSNEEAFPEAVIDRTEDLLATRELAFRFFDSTAYSPADDWVTQLALDGKAGDDAKKKISSAPPYQSGELEIPIVKIYRVHLEGVRNGTKEPRKFPAAYPSVLDALAALAPGAKDLRTAWLDYDKTTAAHARALVMETHLREDAAKAAAAAPPGTVLPDPPELVTAKTTTVKADEDAKRATATLMAALDAVAQADLSDPVRDRIARDGLGVLSVALRTTLEGQALVPVVRKQAARAIQFAQRDLFVSRPADLAGHLGLAEVPARMLEVETRSAEDVAVLERTTRELEAHLMVPRDKTSGFVYRQSIVDQVVGVQWDSVRVHGKLDGEVLFFNQVGTGGLSGDYTGRTRRLEYAVKPIAMAGGRVAVSFDWLHMQNAATLNGSFTTDRFFGANGDIQSSGSLGEQLGLKGLASDVLDIGAGLAGVRTRLKTATFTAGEVRDIAVDRATGRDLATTAKAPLQLAYTQLDVGYDVAFLLPPETVGKYWIEEVLVGFRYMNYRLPRILYELKDVAPPGSDAQDFRFDRQSSAQTLTSRYYMGGGTFRFGQGEGRTISLFGDLGLYGGAGPTAYTFDNGNVEKPVALVFDGSFGLGGRLRLTPRNLRFRVLLEAQYHGELIYQTVISNLRATETANGTQYSVGKKVDFGSVDIYHGPRIQIVGVF